MKRSILILFTAALILFIVTAHAQTKRVVITQVPSKPYTVNRGADPNIKSEIPKEDIKQNAPRGAGMCKVYIETHSGLYVIVFVNGYYAGGLSPYGELILNFSTYDEIYIVSGSSTRYWKVDVDCENENHYRIEYGDTPLPDKQE